MDTYIRFDVRFGCLYLRPGFLARSNPVDSTVLPSWAEAPEDDMNSVP